MALIRYTCAECHVEFEASWHNNRKYCFDCGPLVARAKQAISNAKYGVKYRVTHKQAISNAKYGVKYRAKRRAKNPLLTKAEKLNRRPLRMFLCIDCGVEAQTRIYNTKRCEPCRVLARASRQKIIAREHVARRRSQNPSSYIRRLRKMHRERESCTKCGKAYDITHQLDHIRPLAIYILFGLSGADDWVNLQLLCISCHRKKTNEDVSRIAKLKREFMVKRL